MFNKYEDSKDMKRQFQHQEMQKKPHKRKMREQFTYRLQSRKWQKTETFPKGGMAAVQLY